MTTKMSRKTGISPKAVIAMERSMRLGALTHRVMNFLFWVAIILVLIGAGMLFARLSGG